MVLANIFVLLLVIIVAVVLFKLGKGLSWILINSLVGLVVFIMLNKFFGLGIDINLWSLLIVGIGGVIGLIIVIVLSLLGIAF